jgi:hypothetical protein
MTQMALKQDGDCRRSHPAAEIAARFVIDAKGLALGFAIYSLHRHRDDRDPNPAAMEEMAMARVTGPRLAMATLACALAFTSAVNAQTAPAESTAPPTADNAVMITVFLKHDQSRPLSELNAQLEKQGYYKAFPPAGVEVVSWYVMMGIGQVVTLRLPASRLREINRVLEDKAWGAYRTEFYPTYDYKAVGMAAHEKAQ